MLKSYSNPLLVNLRRAALGLRKPQAVVAANWVAAGLYTRPYSATRHLGVNRGEYEQGQALIRRLATTAATALPFVREGQR